MNKAMQELAAEAFASLVTTMKDYQAPHAEKVHAAQTILKYVYEWPTVDDKPSTE
jgi:hypothetical protein